MKKGLFFLLTDVNLTSLPLEMLEHLCSFLNFKNTTALASTCSHLHSLKGHLLRNKRLTYTITLPRGHNLFQRVGLKWLKTQLPSLEVGRHIRYVELISEERRIPPVFVHHGERLRHMHDRFFKAITNVKKVRVIRLDRAWLLALRPRKISRSTYRDALIRVHSPYIETLCGDFDPDYPRYTWENLRSADLCYQDGPFTPERNFTSELFPAFVQAAPRLQRVEVHLRTYEEYRHPLILPNMTIQCTHKGYSDVFSYWGLFHYVCNKKK